METLTMEILTQQLDQMMTKPAIDIDEQLMALLKAGTLLFDLPIGIISRIENKVYTVRHVYGTDNMNSGDTFNLGDTYCSITTKQNRLLGIDYMNVSDYFRHPCYQLFSLSSYFGVPLWVDGKQFGTLNFSAPSERRPSFTEQEKLTLRVMGNFVSTMLSNQHNG